MHYMIEILAPFNVGATRHQPGKYRIPDDLPAEVAIEQLKAGNAHKLAHVKGGPPENKAAAAAATKAESKAPKEEDDAPLSHAAGKDKPSPSSQAAPARPLTTRSVLGKPEK